MTTPGPSSAPAQAGLGAIWVDRLERRLPLYPSRRTAASREPRRPGRRAPFQHLLVSDDLLRGVDCFRTRWFEQEGGAMVARVASFEGVNVEVAERTMDQAESIIHPMMERLSGYKGHLELVASDGKVLSIALFDSEENARAAEPTFDEEMPRQLGDLFTDWEGRRVSVDQYKVLSESRS